jgi:hypothetical protein
MKLTSLLFTSAALLAGGCVMWHGNTLESDGATETLTFTTSGVGLIPGPCTWNWGKATQTDAYVVLRGVKDNYTESEFEILCGAGTRWNGYHNEDMSGRIAIDRKKQTVTISVQIQGKPFDYNGRHRFKMMQEPNKAPADKAGLPEPGR